jgi:hypothetical protein
VTRRRTTRTSTWALAAAIALTGCTEGANVESRTEADVTAAVQQRAEKVATLIGQALREPATNASPCTGKLGENNRQVFTVQGAYNLTMPAEQQLETVAKVRDTWQTEGYEITDDRVVGDQGVLAAKAPDGYSFYLQTKPPSAALALLVNSPCYRSPTPR